MMHKKNILNLLLLIAVISLATLIYFSEKDNNELGQLTAISTSGITAISIHHNKNTTQLIKHKDGQWLLTEPVNIEANNFRINSVLKLLNAPVHSRYPVTQINLANTGLERPATSITLDDSVIYFGIINPATELRYVRLDDTVYTIDDVYYPLLNSNFSTLVSLNLLPTNSKITKLILPGLTISKDKNDFWQSNVLLSADDINKTIEHWQHGQAFGIHEYMQRSAENTSTPGEIFVYLQDQEQAIRYLITDTDPWLILARPEIGIEYHIDIKAYRGLIPAR
ncbi:MAG: DUF4340 domain-containing protein [Gammaproteobacteria bacterium]|nr:DUF4340 domain-containing protein [Gammaproteobacteria bacterium]